MSSKMALLTFAVLFVAAGARNLQQAPAAAPASSGKPVADLLFVLSADSASFTSPTTLQLEGATSSVQFYGSGARAGVILTPKFLNSSAGATYVAADGSWLDAPDAALHGTFNGSHRAVLLSLSSPQYDPATWTATFNVKVLEAAESGLRVSKGVVNELVAESAAGSGQIIPVIQEGSVLTDVALFIDQNKDSLQPIAETKVWWWWWGRPTYYYPYYGNGCGYYGCGWGWGK
ncbi:hypothetical protein COCSUDRAFT_66316 [Coccomyxa subellipsoidea C-169]|uniref:Uncharacterized protein n=1 Tax=Coccomyxa subellipsoidea (strain C-169) TaxID=574566 RepID=I0YW57_COCSC|nr:hypothetical protein COCSUDRAFT_66316 [Coccomyxa subellipsoidea C-169]EIE22626.1 hypothetical protein COCSUDRAFT_66316 [Coccomyxa subellipsoidea C-169]|eukprot:XP_005647170.1 hypothetical protein COCSUDRAFT_66316 [Coccomyxa subellipsoidea C-169]